MSTSHGHDNAPHMYTSVGGDNPGVLLRFPNLSLHKDAPIMPIIIKSTRAADAQTALGLHGVLRRLGLQTEDQPEALAEAIAESREISDTFPIPGPFYAVYRGKTERAIYVKNFAPDVQTQIHDYIYAKYHRFESIQEALAYMVLKGDFQRMKALNLYKGRLPFPDTSAPGSAFGAPSLSTSTPGQTKLIDSYIRDFTGIIDTIYGSTSGTPVYEDTPVDVDLGKRAVYYLQAHGYDTDTIQEIGSIFNKSQRVDDFVDMLTSRGMAATEVRWLWDHITRV